MRRGRPRKNAIYRFSLDHGGQIYVFGKGTLKEGAKLVRKLDSEFAIRFEKDPDGLFTLDFPFHKVPIKTLEGADICAYNNEDDEICYDTLTYTIKYDNEEEEICYDTLTYKIMYEN